jgi:hypothetical protein
MATRSAVLARLNTTGAGAAFALGTVPVNTTWIVKDIRVRNVSGGNMATYYIYVRSADGTVTLSFLFGPINNNELQSFTGFVVAKDGDTFAGFQSGDGLVVWISGAKLPGVA